MPADRAAGMPASAMRTSHLPCSGTRRRLLGHLRDPPGRSGEESVPYQVVRLRSDTEIGGRLELGTSLLQLSVEVRGDGALDGRSHSGVECKMREPAEPLLYREQLSISDGVASRKRNASTDVGH